MDQSRGCGVAHTAAAAAAAAAAVEQEIVRVVRAAALDPRGRTAHHNQAPAKPDFVHCFNDNVAFFAPTAAVM